MSTGQLTVALFYKYVRVRVGDLDALAAQQTALTSTLGLTGRVRLAPEGINGHLSGPVAAITTYREHNEQNPLLSGIQYKLTQSDGDPFSGELFVVVRDEITATGQMQTQLPIALGGTGGKHLTAQEFHQAVLGCQAGTDAATGRRQVLGSTSVSVYLYVCICMSLPVYLCLYVHMPVCLCLYVYPPIDTPVYLYTCTPIHLYTQTTHRTLRTRC
ncbi:hypothetical protein B484DRAFT_463354 [Ochromonadaceae sp. CCMP2298]|nr:hypothetical protein B484DRAFT_463354 [Ochromonadaceae sp. CCMP2298]|mmetsp:Transcript_4244/g.9334  ORF Transcript_4244/g.9334 Transcript_4244/m.9334 type:complete len:215 (-) Transcript_4244:574-1218(-)